MNGMVGTRSMRRERPEKVDAVLDVWSPCISTRHASGRESQACTARSTTPGEYCLGPCRETSVSIGRGSISRRPPTDLFDEREEIGISAIGAHHERR